MGAAAAAATVVSTLASASASQKRARAEREALRRRSEIQRLQADERLRQLDRDTDIFQSRGEVAFGDVVSGYAKAGVSIGSGSPLLAMASSQRNLDNSLEEMKRKGKTEADLIRKGADQLDSAADNIDPSMEILGTIMGGVGKLASLDKD